MKVIDLDTQNECRSKIRIEIPELELNLELSYYRSKYKNKELAEKIIEFVKQELNK